MHAMLITPDYQIEVIELPKGSRKQLELMYSRLNCFAVDVVRLTRTLDMWIDDEGAFTGEVNPLASDFAASFGFVFQPYFGTVMLTGGVDRSGDTVGLSDAQVTMLKARLTDLGALV